jgi:bacterial/archaeal transporter family protein
MMTFLMLLTNILSTSAGEVLITRGMKQIGEISSLRLGTLLKIAVKVLSNPSFLAGLACMAASYFSFLAALSGADMSFIVPITSLAYVVSSLGARFILKESINLMRWAGVLLVCAGATLVSLP